MENKLGSLTTVVKPSMRSEQSLDYFESSLTAIRSLVCSRDTPCGLKDRSDECQFEWNKRITKANTGKVSIFLYTANGMLRIGRGKRLCSKIRWERQNRNNRQPHDHNDDYRKTLHSTDGQEGSLCIPNVASPHDFTTPRRAVPYLQIPS
mmetsp:Transcript_20/g.31  ORF Transcript_20/g.31 Transcript_20/m.31 type:complete len:150 (-) Transcript_20:72-521(-)